jgi:hypothetical protein
MRDFLKWVLLCASVMVVAGVSINHESRLKAVEQAVPLPCRTVQSLLKNRPIPAIHSYAKPIPVCEEQK